MDAYKDIERTDAEIKLIRAQTDAKEREIEAIAQARERELEARARLNPVAQVVYAFFDGIVLLTQKIDNFALFIIVMFFLYMITQIFD